MTNASTTVNGYAPATHDVIVVGGGNAGLCAAITAAEAGCRVVVLECAEPHMRGGNSRHTRNLRSVHDAATEVLTGPYPMDEFLTDLRRVTGDATNLPLAELTLRESESLPDWLHARGVRFQASLQGTLSLGRTNAFFLGGGKALLNALYRHAEALGVEVQYGASVEDIEIVDGMFRSVQVRRGSATERMTGKALVAAAGGFEANLEWLSEAWGEAAQNFLVRGSPHNRGTVLRCLLHRGVKAVGDPKQCHAVAIDGRAPKYDGGIVTRLDCIPFGVVLNQSGERFYDEGEDFWPKRYAIWGRLVADQPGQLAHVLIDAKSADLYVPGAFPPIQADSLDELFARLELPVDAAKATVQAFNDACHAGQFDPATLDDCQTRDLTPPKSHWARPVDTPPYFAYPLRPGITFTYLGVQVDAAARMVLESGQTIPNGFAAGEIMAGNVLGRGYLAGIGMTIGGVFGRIAGHSAAQHV